MMQRLSVVLCVLLLACAGAAYGEGAATPLETRLSENVPTQQQEAAPLIWRRLSEAPEPALEEHEEDDDPDHKSKADAAHAERGEEHPVEPNQDVDENTPDDDPEAEAKAEQFKKENKHLFENKAELRRRLSEEEPDDDPEHEAKAKAAHADRGDHPDDPQPEVNHEAEDDDPEGAAKAEAFKKENAHLFEDKDELRR